jgi:hypothetical protein
MSRAQTDHAICLRLQSADMSVQCLTFVCHGARLGIRAHDLCVLEHASGLLPPAARIETLTQIDAWYELSGGCGEPENPRPHRLQSGSELIASSIELEPVLHELASSLHFAVARYARGSLFVHAGVVGWKGYAILIPGSTLSGKTSLVRALVRAGADYLSDEYAVLDHEGRVHPYPKALSIRNAAGVARLVPVEEIGGRAATTALPVGMIVSTRYEANGEWRPRVLSRGQALMVLIENTIIVREQPAFTMDTLARAVRDAAVLAGARGEASLMADSLLAAM